MSYTPNDGRYDQMQYRRAGRGGLRLPALSLGLWHNFGHNARQDVAREMCRKAFDLGITHSTSPIITAHRPDRPKSNLARL